MIYSNPPWFKLVKLLKKNGKISTGLTIPYIFGAYKLLGQPFVSIKQVVEHIHNSRIEEAYPVIQKCYEIEHHVVMPASTEYCNRNFKTEIKFKNPENGNILFVSSNTKLGNALSEVSRSLEANYLMPIKNQTFSWSKEDKSWIQFNKEEIDMIKSIQNKS